MRKNVDLRKVPGRRTIKTINQSDIYLKGTDLVSLNDRGLEDLHSYVKSGFTLIPQKISFRTDTAQIEAELLTEVEQLEIVEESLPADVDEFNYNEID